MTRRRKLLLWLLVTPLALVLLLIVLAFTPMVQTSVVKRFLAGQKDFRAGVTRVAASTAGVALEGLDFEQPGVKLTMPKLELEAPLMDAATGKVQVRKLVARDWVIEVDPAAMAPTKAPAQAAMTKGDAAPSKSKPASPFEGLLSAISLPSGIAVDGVDMRGELRVKGQQPVQARIVLAADAIGAGRTGKLSFNVKATTADGPVNVTAELQPVLTAEGALQSLAVIVNGVARGAQVRATVDAKRVDGGGESYALRVMAGDRSLLEATGDWKKGEAFMPLKWKAGFSDADLKPLMAGILSSAFQLDGEGTARIGLAAEPDAQVVGALKLKVSNWKRVPALAGRDPGDITLDTHWDAGWSGGKLDVRQLQLTLEGVAPIRVEALQPFAFNPAKQELRAEKPDLDVLRVQVAGLKPEVLAPFLPPGMQLTGDPLTLGIAARPEGQGVRLAMTEDLVWAKLRVAQDGSDLLALDEVRWGGLVAAVIPGDIKADVGHLTLKAGGREVLAISGKVTQAANTPLTVVADVTSALADLLKQPALAKMVNLKAGQLDLHAEASLAEVTTVKSALRAQGLAAGNGTALPDVTVVVGLTRNADGAVQLRAPMSISNTQQKRTSDVELAAAIKLPAKPGAPTELQSSVRSAFIQVSDLEAFTALLPTAAPKTGAAKPTGAAAAPVAVAPPAASEASPAPAAVSTKGVAPAPWAAVSGKIEVDLAKVAYAPGMEFGQIKGALELTPEAAALKQLSLMLKGGTITADGTLLRSDEAYRADVKFGVAGLAITPLLEYASPAMASKASGTLNLKGTLIGSHRDYISAFTSAPVNLQIDCRNGELRALSFSPLDKVGSTVGKVASTANKALGFLQKFGGAVGKAPPVSKGTTDALAKTEAVAGVQQALSRIGYDSVLIGLDYLPDQAVDIREFKLTSATMQLTGGGKIALGNQTITNSPLSMKLGLAARGDLSRHLFVLGLINSQSPDSYTPVIEPLTLDGTLSNIGTKQVEKWLRRSLPGLP